MKKFLIVSFIFMMLSILSASVLSLWDKILQIEISKIDRAMRIQREDLQNLKAQWNYLSSKTSINFLVKKHLPQMRNLDLQLDTKLDRLSALPNKPSDDKNQN